MTISRSFVVGRPLLKLNETSENSYESTLETVEGGYKCHVIMLS